MIKIKLKKIAYHINNKYACECFLFIYFHLVKSLCQNTIFIFKRKIANESYEVRMEKIAEK